MTIWGLGERLFNYLATLRAHTPLSSPGLTRWPSTPRRSKF